MKKKMPRLFIKIFVTIVSFVLIFFVLQLFFIPKFIDHEAVSTVIINDYKHFESNSVDILFYGSSQMFCGINSVLLFEKYNISAYDYGASRQALSITPYYLLESLKTQSPKVVAVEMASVFQKNEELTPRELAWNYAPTPLTKEKVESLEQTLGNKWKAYQYAFFPLLVYHDRWRVLGQQSDFDCRYDFEYVFHPDKYLGLYPRGYISDDSIREQSYNFRNSDTELKKIPEESKNAIDCIAEICREKNIKLLFFKVPVSLWTRGESASVKQIMEARGLDFIDLNDYAQEIAIDEKTDFSDIRHLNTSGAKKVTDYIAKILQSYMS